MLAKKNPGFVLLTILVAVLSYGFFATQYSFHIDSFIPDYYDGTRLISAGRWSAATIHLFTNWMQFSPFWQTILMCILLFIAGITMSLLFQREAKNIIKDKVLFLFICFFISNPLHASQLTYPNLNIALSYCLVPLSFWILNPFCGKIDIKKALLSLIPLTIGIDSYESFASVYLVILFGTLLLKILLDQFNGKNFKYLLSYFAKVCICCVSLLAFAIILDFIISKLICKILTGSFDFWYSGNSTFHWAEAINSGGIFGAIKKLVIKQILPDFFLAQTENLWCFIRFFSFITLSVITGIHSFRNKFNFSKLFFSFSFLVCFFIASISLDLVIGRLCYVRQIQHSLVFSSISLLMVFIFLSKSSNITKSICSTFICIFLFLQTQTINNISVINYERFVYETNILTNVSEDLTKFDLQRKSVLFLCEKDYDLPKSFQKQNATHPIARNYKILVCKLWDAFCGDYLNSNNTIGHQRYVMSANKSYIRWAVPSPRSEGTSFKPLTITMAKLGVSINEIEIGTKETEEYLSQVKYEKGQKYVIQETDDLIIVTFISPT